MTLDALKDDADRDTEFQLKGNEALVGNQGRGGLATAVARSHAALFAAWHLRCRHLLLL